MNGVLHDLRYAFRGFRARPLFALAVVLTLVLGIGANAAIFSLLNGIVLRPLPFRQPDRIVVLGETSATASSNLASPHSYVYWRERSRAFEQMAGAIWWEGSSLGTGGDPEPITTVAVTANYFSVMGVAPLLGRTFTPEEVRPGNNSRSVILSHDLWRRRFNADRAIVGMTLQIDGRPHTVVGVMPDAYADVEVGWSDIWTPWMLNENSVRVSRPRYRMVRVLARLAPGVTLARARADLSVVHAGLQPEFPEVDAGYDLLFRPLHDFVIRDARPILLILLGGVACVLLLACANVTNLQLARASTRDAEMSIRAALGASRGRLLRQCLTEALALSVIGGCVGLAGAYWSIQLLSAGAAGAIPRIQDVALDGRVLAFCAFVTLAAALCSGLLPALRVVRSRNLEWLHGGRAGAAPANGRVRRTLVAAEVGCAVMLLVGAGLALRSFTRLMKTDPGYNRERVLTFDVVTASSRYSEGFRRAAFFRELIDRQQRLPGVQHVGAMRYFLYRNRLWTNRVFAEDRPVPPGREPVVHYNGVAGDYFRAMAIPLVAGRLFTERDMWETGGVVVINESMARQLWPGESAVGRRMRHDGGKEFETVVGVVADVRQRRLDEPGAAEMYETFAGYQHANMTFAVRTASNPIGLTDAVRAQVHEMDPQLAVSHVMPLNDAAEATVGERRLAMSLLSLFGLVSLAPAGFGVYAVMSYLVSQQIRDLGVRIALGARSLDLLATVLTDTAGAVFLGTAAGLAASAAIAVAMRRLLFGVAPLDGVTFAAAPAMLMLVAIVAALLPARRATRVDPLVALKKT